MPANPAAIAHGPMLIGVMINVLLMDVIVMQSYVYFSNYRQWLLVASVLFANFLNSGFAVADLYLALINHFVDHRLDDIHNFSRRYDHIHSSLVSVSFLFDLLSSLALTEATKPDCKALINLSIVSSGAITVQTGMLTSIWALLDLVLFLTLMRLFTL
ncbi:hypothetical protein B0H17DRAFT_1210800 [Mycena rosella]|uniref:Uncharacterized protein n=1 Tax=Mycena rosella TaxID=1033263 RepID=A0AAD7CW60_MYCRO|nr:hypothetical protein B0H17DRAFT_1210800 [Mycena rosella]